MNINIVRVLDSFLDSTKRRIIKVLRSGKSDAATALEALPFGFDSNPPKDMRAIFADTTQDGKRVIIGYLNKNQLSAKGESRIFSVDSNGVLKGFIHCKADGKILFSGSTNHLVQYEALNSGLQDENTSINTELQKIQAAISGLGGTYTRSQVDLDISSSKLNNLLTP